MNKEDWFQEHRDEIDPNQLEFDFGDEFSYVKIKTSLIKEFKESLLARARNSMVANEILFEFNQIVK